MFTAILCYQFVTLSQKGSIEQVTNNRWARFGAGGLLCICYDDLLMWMQKYSQYLVLLEAEVMGF